MRSLRQSLSAVTILATVIAASGCPSTPLLVNARPLGNGKNAVIVAGTVYGVSLASTGSSSSNSDVSGLLTVPTLDLMYRHGFGNRFDMGFALTGWGKVSVDGKINILNSPRFAFSIDPGIGGFFLAAGDVGAGYMQFTVPFLFDIAFSPSSRLTLAPMYSGIYTFASGGSGTGSSGSASVYTHLIGGNVGFEFTLSRLFRLQPFVGATWLYNSNLSKSSASISSVWWNAGLAAKFVF